MSPARSATVVGRPRTRADWQTERAMLDDVAEKADALDAAVRRLLAWRKRLGSADRRFGAPPIKEVSP
jgi:hypothetical protein